MEVTEVTDFNPNPDPKPNQVLWSLKLYDKGVSPFCFWSCFDVCVYVCVCLRVNYE